MQREVQYVPAYTNHLLHLVLTLVTLGLWFPVWVIVWLVNHNRVVPRTDWLVQPCAVLPTQYPGWNWCTVHGGYEPNGQASAQQLPRS